MSIKALALLSGGLDSLLAAKLIQNQGVKVTGLSFKSYFFNPKALSASWRIISDFSSSHLKIVLKPKYGYGKNMNPCLDCHLLMLKEAKKIMVKNNYQFIITGEVLGQRPFSQTRHNLNLLEKESGLTGLILRPLSAQLLPATIPEQKGWVKREKLLSINGRSRHIQLQLAKKFGLTNFSAPGTSCILTDPAYSQRLKQLIVNCPHPKANDLALLKLGRHFYFPSQARSPQDEPGIYLIIVGRNHQENLALKKLKQKKDILLELKSLPGPTVLIRPYHSQSITQPIINYAKQLLLSHSRHVSNKNRSETDFKVEKCR